MLPGGLLIDHVGKRIRLIQGSVGSGEERVFQDQRQGGEMAELFFGKKVSVVLQRFPYFGAVLEGDLGGQQGGLVVAEEGMGKTPPDQAQTFDRMGSVSDHVPQGDEMTNFPQIQDTEHGLKGVDVSVDIR